MGGPGYRIEPYSKLRGVCARITNIALPDLEPNILTVSHPTATTSSFHLARSTGSGYHAFCPDIQTPPYLHWICPVIVGFFLYF